MIIETITDFLLAEPKGVPNWIVMSILFIIMTIIYWVMLGYHHKEARVITSIILLLCLSILITILGAN